MCCATPENRLAVRDQAGQNLDVLLEKRFSFINKLLKEGDSVLEVGAGIGLTADFVPHIDLIQTDIEPNPWVDVTTSAETLPFQDSHFDSVICALVLHHLDFPLKSLREMSRVLKPGGTVFIIEPNDSLLLRMLLSLTKHEYIDINVDPFGAKTCQTRGEGIWDGNNAVGRLLFFDTERLHKNLPELKITHQRFVETFIFMNSGGVNHKTPYLPLPKIILEGVHYLDRLLCRIAPRIFALHMEVVMKKNSCP